MMDFFEVLAGFASVIYFFVIGFVIYLGYRFVKAIEKIADTYEKNNIN